MKINVSYICTLFITANITRMVVVSAQPTCPPENFDAVKDLDFSGFIEAPWYSVKQLEVFYQPLNQFYCVSAEYTLLERKSIYCRLFGCEDPPSIQVFNSARRGSVNGRVNSIRFQAVLTDVENEPAKALVGPPISPRPLRRGSNYWVVAVGKYSDLGAYDETDNTYDYAIITSGEPGSVGNNGCYSEGGMWLFSRNAVPEQGIIAKLEEVAKSLGLDSDILEYVVQEGCA